MNVRRSIAIQLPPTAGRTAIVKLSASILSSISPADVPEEPADATTLVAKGQPAVQIHALGGDARGSSCTWTARRIALTGSCDCCGPYPALFLLFFGCFDSRFL